MTWQPTCSADEFAAGYAARSGTTVDRLRELGRAPRPCDCGEDECDGWMMVNVELHDEDLAAWRRGVGPHPGRLSAADQEDFENGLTGGSTPESDSAVADSSPSETS